MKPAGPSIFSAPCQLNPTHDVSRFDCGNDQINMWLQKRALQSEKTSRTYVVATGNVIVGYHAIAVGGVNRADLPRGLRHNTPTDVPVLLLARLAVDRSSAGRRLGSSLLAHALRQVLSAYNIIGAQALLVHAIDDEARRFCIDRAEFQGYPADSRTLFLPIETLIDSLGP